MSVRWRVSRSILGVTGASILLALLMITTAQTSLWRNTTLLFEPATDVTTDNDLAHYILGMEFQRKGKPGQAVAHLQEALRISPDNGEFHNRLGEVLTKQGELDGQRVWVQVGTECERLLDAFIKLPSSIVWTFWEELTSTDQYTKGLPWKRDTPGNGAFQAIKRSFDFVFRLTRDGEAVVAQCGNSTKAYAKRRDDWTQVKGPAEIKPFRLDEFVKMMQTDKP